MFTLDDIREIWKSVKNDFETDFNIAPSTADLWFGDLTVDSVEDGKITLASASEYKTKFIKNKYMGMIAEGFENHLGIRPEIEVYFPGDKKTEENTETENKETPEEIKKENPEKKIPKSTMLPTVNFEYTFDNFIEGSSNTFARAACWAVAKNVVEAEEGNTASQYNPLFLYGPSGIGKTHLMYAITNKIRSEKPNATIMYIKGEDFTNQLIDSLAVQGMAQFREKYRQCDILMIDDIQFIGSKVATQEEFFHTFNALYENEKQIIMTSDRSPREIPDLEKRLV